jgi:hypothetical protein
MAGTEPSASRTIGALDRHRRDTMSGRVLVESLASVGASAIIAAMVVIGGAAIAPADGVVVRHAPAEGRAAAMDTDPLFICSMVGDGEVTSCVREES